MTAAPLSIKWHHRETSRSYLRRHCAEHGIPWSAIEARVRVMTQERGVIAQEALDHLAQSIAMKPPGFIHALASQAQPIRGIPYPSRWACKLCTGGEQVAQFAHDAENLCLKHNRQVVWLGPGSRPHNQLVVPSTPTIRRSERRFRSHAISQRFTPDLTTAAWLAVRDNAAALQGTNWNPILKDLMSRDGASWEVEGRLALYPQTVFVAEALTGPAELSEWLDPALPPERVSYLIAAHLHASGLFDSGSWLLVTRMLQTLRPLRQHARNWHKDPHWQSSETPWSMYLESVDTSAWKQPAL